MKLPRDLSGRDLCGRLARHYGYTVTRQRGSHMTMERVTEAGEHSLTVPAHSALRTGTLNAIVNEVAEGVGLSSQAVKETLFG